MKAHRHIWPSPSVKICCIKTLGEALAALTAGADALGLVSSMPSGPGVIEESEIAKIVSALPDGTRSFLLTSATDAGTIIAQHQRCRTTHLQLVDALPPGELERLRDGLPDVELVQVIHVHGEDSLTQAIEMAGKVDMLLLDSGNPALAIKQLGGTGRAHNWEISARICAEVNVPVFLAGGIGAHNIAAAVNTVKPTGIDLCSSVRSNDNLDPVKLNELFSAVRTIRQ